MTVETLAKNISMKGPRNRRSLASLLMNDKPTKLPVEDRGIPHLAKNERDVGHPSSVAGTGGLSFHLPTGSRKSFARDDKKGRIAVKGGKVRNRKLALRGLAGFELLTLDPMSKED
jgi:hypothetical protein